MSFLSKTMLRVVGFVWVTIMLGALLGWWLWGEAAPYRGRALLDAVRQSALRAEPLEMQVGSLDARRQAAARETRQLAVQIGQVQAELQAVEQRVGQLRDKQQQTRVLLGQVRQRLDRCPTEGTVTIAGQTFCHGDLKHEIHLLVDRYEHGELAIADRQHYQATLASRREKLRRQLRDRIGRLRGLERGREQIAMLLDDRTFLAGLAAAEGGYAEARALLGAELQADELLSQLQREVATARIVQDMADDGAVSVADAVRLEESPSWEARLERVLGQ